MLVVGADAGEHGYSFPGFYYASMSDKLNIDVMKAATIQEIDEHLSEYSKKCTNIFIADHGYTYNGAGQTLTHSSTDSKEAYSGYREEVVKANPVFFQILQIIFKRMEI